MSELGAALIAEKLLLSEPPPFARSIGSKAQTTAIWNPSSSSTMAAAGGVRAAMPTLVGTGPAGGGRGGHLLAPQLVAAVASAYQRHAVHAALRVQQAAAEPPQPLAAARQQAIPLPATAGAAVAQYGVGTPHQDAAACAASLHLQQKAAISFAAAAISKRLTQSSALELQRQGGISPTALGVAGVMPAPEELLAEQKPVACSSSMPPIVGNAGGVRRPASAEQKEHHPAPKRVKTEAAVAAGNSSLPPGIPAASAASYLRGAPATGAAGAPSARSASSPAADLESPPAVSDGRSSLAARQSRVLLFSQNSAKTGLAAAPAFMVRTKKCMNAAAARGGAAAATTLPGDAAAPATAAALLARAASGSGSSAGEASAAAAAQQALRVPSPGLKPDLSFSGGGYAVLPPEDGLQGIAPLSQQQPQVPAGGTDSSIKQPRDPRIVVAQAQQRQNQQQPQETGENPVPATSGAALPGLPGLALGTGATAAAPSAPTAEQLQQGGGGPTGTAGAAPPGPVASGSSGEPAAWLLPAPTAEPAAAAPPLLGSDQQQQALPHAAASLPSGGAGTVAIAGAPPPTSALSATTAAPAPAPAAAQAAHTYPPYYYPQHYSYPLVGATYPASYFYPAHAGGWWAAGYGGAPPPPTSAYHAAWAQGMAPWHYPSAAAAAPGVAGAAVVVPPPLPPAAPQPPPGDPPPPAATT